MSNLLVAPSLLAADFSRLADEIKYLEDAGADLLHLDIMDGHFVPNLSFGQFIIEKIASLTKLPLDVHLMVTNPEDYIDQLIELKVANITWHIELTLHHDRLIDSIKNAGLRAGVALNPSTSLSYLDYVLEKLDMVLIMSVNPGFAGQQFLNSQIAKLQQLQQMLTVHNVDQLLIAVDGGVNLNSLAKIRHLGVNMVVLGSYLFQQSDYTQAISNIKNC